MKPSCKRKLLITLIVPTLGLVTAGLAAGAASDAAAPGTGTMTKPSGTATGDVGNAAQGATAGTGSAVGNPSTSATPGTSGAGGTEGTRAGTKGTADKTDVRGTVGAPAGRAPAAQAAGGTMSKEQIDRLFDQLDTNHDGVLSRDEFSRAVVRQ